MMHLKPINPAFRYSNAVLRSSDRRTFLWLIASLIILAWLTLWIWDRSPYGRYLDHGRLGEIGLFNGATSLVAPVILYLVGWTLMTVAMMLPTTLPILEIFRRLTARREDRWQLMALVITGYLGVWAGFGVAAHSADWVLHEVVENAVDGLRRMPGLSV